MMTRALLVSFFIVLCTLCTITSLDIAQKKVIIRRLGQCKGSKGLPVLFHDVVIAPNAGRTNRTLSLKVAVRKEVSNKFSVVMNFRRCDSSGNPDLCEIVLKDYNVTDLCTMMDAKNELWTQFIDYFDMPAKCPIKVGTYSLNAMPITTDLLKFLPVSDALWKVRFVGWDGDSYLGCVELEMQIVASYKRKNVGKRRHFTASYADK